MVVKGKSLQMTYLNQQLLILQKSELCDFFARMIITFAPRLRTFSP